MASQELNAVISMLRAQTPAELRSLVNHRFQAEFHQLVCGYQPGNARADDRHFSAVIMFRNTAEAGRVFDPVVKRERKVRAENGDWFLTVCRMAIVLVHG